MHHWSIFFDGLKVISHCLFLIQAEAQSRMKENSDSNHCHTENRGKKPAQPFIQAAHRGSVIVFSSSQRLGPDRSQDTLKTTGADVPLQLCVDRPTSHNTLPLLSDQRNQSLINPSLDLTKQSQSKGNHETKINLVVCFLPHSGVNDHIGLML